MKSNLLKHDGLKWTPEGSRLADPRCCTELLAELCGNGGDAAQMVESRGLARVDDAEQYGKRNLWWRNIRRRPNVFCAGDPRVMGFFMGQAMRVFGGKVDAQEMQASLRRAPVE